MKEIKMRYVKSKYGWIPDLPDNRDKVYNLSLPTLNLPNMVDLRAGKAVLYNQLSLGSCTANGIGAAIAYKLKKQNVAFHPSRLFIYYNERVVEGTVSVDAGAMIRDGIKSVASTGVCSEAIWPYIPSGFATTPSQNCYDAAKKDVVEQYLSISQDVTLNNLRTQLAAGNPVVFGFSVYESFESQQVILTGNAPYPGNSEQMLGGHCCLAMGYNIGPEVSIVGDVTGRIFKFPGNTILCQNSWGLEFGIDGFFTIPIDYLSNTNLASDFWTIELVNNIPQ